MIARITISSKKLINKNLTTKLIWKSFQKIHFRLPPTQIFVVIFCYSFTYINLTIPYNHIQTQKMFLKMRFLVIQFHYVVPCWFQFLDHVDLLHAHYDLNAHIHRCWWIIFLVEAWEHFFKVSHVKIIPFFCVQREHMVFYAAQL